MERGVSHRCTPTRGTRTHSPAKLARDRPCNRTPLPTQPISIRSASRANVPIRPHAAPRTDATAGHGVQVPALLPKPQHGNAHQLLSEAGLPHPLLPLLLSSASLRGLRRLLARLSKPALAMGSLHAHPIRVRHKLLPSLPISLHRRGDLPVRSRKCHRTPAYCPMARRTRSRRPVIFPMRHRFWLLLQPELCFQSRKRTTPRRSKSDTSKHARPIARLCTILPSTCFSRRVGVQRSRHRRLPHRLGTRPGPH